jgi:hypothetical protein
MVDDYDIFEKDNDNSLRWHYHADGLEDAQLKLQEIAQQTKKECFAINLATQQIVAIVKPEHAK